MLDEAEACVHERYPQIDHKVNLKTKRFNVHKASNAWQTLSECL